MSVKEDATLFKQIDYLNLILDEIIAKKKIELYIDLKTQPTNKDILDEINLLMEVEENIRGKIKKLEDGFKEWKCYGFIEEAGLSLFHSGTSRKGNKILWEFNI